MIRDNDWFEFKTLKRRGYDSQVWVPLRASYAKGREGEYGYVGFAEENLHVGVLAIPVSHEAVVREADSNTIRDAGRSVPYVDDQGLYIRADQVVGFYKGIDGLRLVLEQSVPGVDHCQGRRKVPHFGRRKNPHPTRKECC